MKQISDVAISTRLWLSTVLALTVIFLVYCLIDSSLDGIILTLAFGFFALIGSFPALVVYAMVLPSIRSSRITMAWKTAAVCLLAAAIVLCYSIPACMILSGKESNDFLETICVTFLPLAVSAGFAIAINWNLLRRGYLEPATPDNIETINQINPHMEPYVTEQVTVPEQPQNNNNKPLTKGLVTAGLILLMLIPTLFISNLVRERQSRQVEVVRDVASKWALAQTLTGPYLYIPYQQPEKLGSGRTVLHNRHLILLPDELAVTGDVIPEQRERSIYKVLLYKASLNSKGNFQLTLPKEIDPAWVILADVKVCMGITDFKGIEKKVSVNLNGKNYDLAPGLPVNDIDDSGLSANIDLTAQQFGSTIAFDMPLHIRGSRQLHFAPLSGNSQFTLRSAWNSPSFDGTTLPSAREVNDKGFSATWTFNKANLPFNTIVRGTKMDKKAFSFGVSMLQPADQYAKTERSVKYALLIIGLTFSLFFIIELLQKRPVHPVQYVLVGIALMIFYTLLLSISEFILFDKAYLVAATATVLLISLYVKGHFKNWKTAVVMGTTLAGLYGFIFVLIRLEDTALLLGSIGLFIILSAVMYASRKINWYPSMQTAS